MVLNWLALDRRYVIIGVIALLLAGFGVETHLRADKVHVTAYFPTTIGVFKGSEVRLMGVPIGTVTSTDPEGDRVRVEMEYDGRYQVPADAQAVIISPSVISDRFVQLTPGYDGQGPLLADGAVLDEDRTHVPVELDQVFATTNDLLTALGPHGANDKGALNRLLHVSAGTLRGTGPDIRSTIAGLSSASATLGDTSGDFFSTVRHLGRFTSSLASSNGDVRRFNREMATVASYLSSERGDLSQTLTTLARTFGVVERFVKNNRDLLVTNVDHLTRIAYALDSERTSLVAILKLVPVGASNMARSWDPAQQIVRARANEGHLLDDLGNLLCDSLQNAGVPSPAQACTKLHQLLAGALG